MKKKSHFKIRTVKIIFFFSVLAAFLVVGNYLLGIIVCWCLIRYQSKASFCLQRLTSFYKGHILPQRSVSVQCTVCNNEACNRHISQYVKHPWKNIIVTKKLNEAVEQVFNIYLYYPLQI